MNNISQADPGLTIKEKVEALNAEIMKRIQATCDKVNSRGYMRDQGFQFNWEFSGNIKTVDPKYYVGELKVIKQYPPDRYSRKMREYVDSACTAYILDAKVTTSGERWMERSLVPVFLTSGDMCSIYRPQRDVFKTQSVGGQMNRAEFTDWVRDNVRESDIVGVLEWGMQS